MWHVYGLIFGLGLLGLAVFFIRQEGKKAARLEALKREAREVARVQEVLDQVERLPIGVVRQRLYNTRR